MLPEPLDDTALDRIWRRARTHNVWLDRPVDPALLRQAYELARMGPTSANCQPLRLVFVVSPAAKEKLKPALSSGNRDKTMQAPVTAIVAHDTQFFELLPRLFHDQGARSWFAGKPHAYETALRNGSLQAAYFILALRALGLDCGPMSGFDNAAVDAEFFADGRYRSNFLVNMGHGDPSGNYPRGPRLSFEQAAEIL